MGNRPYGLGYHNGKKMGELIGGIIGFVGGAVVLLLLGWTPW